jgi:hypothetical protein
MNSFDFVLILFNAIAAPRKIAMIAAQEPCRDPLMVYDKHITLDR